MPVWSLSDTVRIILKYGFFVTLFTLVILPLAYFFMGKANQIASILMNSLSSVGHSTGGFNGCILTLVGLDSFLNSFISMISGAMIFWFVSVGGLLTYKLSLKAYSYLFKATT